MFKDGLETFYTVPEQVTLFLWSVLMGTALGAVYDVFRAVRIIFPAAGKPVPTAAADILYMLIFGISVFVFSSVIGRGEVRFFYAAGAGLGALLYICTAGNTVTGLLRRLSEAVRRGIKKAAGLISTSEKLRH